MPTAVVPSGAQSRRPGPVLLVHLLLTVSVVPCAEPSRGPAGVDLISRTPNPAIRQRLIALERRFVRGLWCRDSAPPCPDQGQGSRIVFFQFRNGWDDGGDVDLLNVAVGTFAQRPRRSVVIFSGASDTNDTSVGDDSLCTVAVILLPDIASTAPVSSVSRILPLAMKLILLPGTPMAEDLSDADTLLRALWRTERTLRTVIVWYQAPEMAVGVFDPFATDPSTGDQGRFHTVTDLDRPLPTDHDRFGRRMNLNQTPLDIYGFEAAMAYRRQDIDMLPRTFPNTSHGTDLFLDSIFGADVDALLELAHRMNFQPRVHYVRGNFGFKMPNGTFTGVLGRLVSRDSWLSMNVYFFKDYETQLVQFGPAVYQDSLCVFVKAAGMLPDWLLIFRCFTPMLWIVVWGTVVLVGLCYIALAQWIAIVRPDKPRTESTATRPVAPPQDTAGLVGQIVGAMLNAPTNGMNRTTAHQKLFVAFGLIWGLTITGAFQGSLVDVYTTPRSMRNLDTLADLEASGLTITVNAPALIVDVFGTERPGSTLGNLRQRLVIEEHPVRPTRVEVLNGQTAGLIRNQDFGRLSTKYLADDGTPRLHRLRQCPRSYTLAYLYPRGSPLYQAANGHILHFLQHGLFAKWERDAAHILAMNRALKVRRYSRQPNGGQVTLRLGHLLLPFMLLAAGHTLAMICFAYERRPGKA